MFILLSAHFHLLCYRAILDAARWAEFDFLARGRSYEPYEPAVEECAHPADMPVLVDTTAYGMHIEEAPVRWVVRDLTDSEIHDRMRGIESEAERFAARTAYRV